MATNPPLSPLHLLHHRGLNFGPHLHIHLHHNINRSVAKAGGNHRNGLALLEVVHSKSLPELVRMKLGNAGTLHTLSASSTRTPVTISISIDSNIHILIYPFFKHINSYILYHNFSILAGTMSNS